MIISTVLICIRDLRVHSKILLSLSEDVQTKQTNPHTLIAGQSHNLQRKDEISLHPLDQALQKEFLEK